MLTQAILGPAFPAVLLREIDVDLVHDVCVDLRRARQANAKREVVQPCDADALAVHAFEDARNSRKEDWIG